MHVLSVSSLKGGVGKTTVALGLASAAFARGLKTLVVDLDPQCDATTGLGAVGEFKTTVASVLKNPKHNVVSDSIVSSTWGKAGGGSVDIMVGSPRSIHHDTPHPTLRQAMLFQRPHLLRLSALHNVALGIWLDRTQGLNWSQSLARAGAALQRVGLSAVAVPHLLLHGVAPLCEASARRRTQSLQLEPRMTVGSPA